MLRIETGQALSYFGGGSISINSFLKASTDVKPPIQAFSEPIAQQLMTFDHKIALVGLAVVIARFGWDIWRYVQKVNYYKKRDKKDGC